MVEIVNLRRVRKAKARDAAAANADQNRVQFGRTKAERKLTTAQDQLVSKVHEAHRLERPASSDPLHD